MALMYHEIQFGRPFCALRWRFCRASNLHGENGGLGDKTRIKKMFVYIHILSSALDIVGSFVFGSHFIASITNRSIFSVYSNMGSDICLVLHFWIFNDQLTIWVTAQVQYQFSAMNTEQYHIHTVNSGLDEKLDLEKVASII